MYSDFADDWGYDEFDVEEGWDAAGYLPPLPAPRAVSPATVQQRLRQAGASGIRVGEIVPTTAVERGLGQLVRRKEEQWPSGRRALVTYDERGNVYMRVYTAGMNPTGNWFQIGAVSMRGLPADRQARGVAVEPRVRGLVSRATGIRFQAKRGNQGRPDLQPVGQRAGARSRAGVGRSRFDEFLAWADAW